MGSSDTGTIAIDTIELSFPIEGLGFGCVFATPANPQRQPFDNNGISRNLSAFLVEMAAMTARPLSSYEKEWRPLPQTIDPVPRTQPTTLLYSMLSNASESEQQQLQQEQQPPPHGMVLVRGTARYEFLTTGVEVEGGQDTTKASQIVDVMFPWESAPRKQHARNLSVTDFLIDQFPVTIEDYDAYQKRSGYVPKDGHNWLKNWGWPHSGRRRVPTVPEALARVPVTYVSFDEAAAYCNAHGKRLPSTIEWQYAGQGTTNRRYPWGDADDPSCRPMLHDNRTLPGALPVETFASTGNCSSVFNVSDMIGAGKTPFCCAVVFLLDMTICQDRLGTDTLYQGELIRGLRFCSCRERLAANLKLHRQPHASRGPEGRQQLPPNLQTRRARFQPEQGGLLLPPGAQLGRA